jgi:glucosylceramidase
VQLLPIPNIYAQDVVGIASFPAVTVIALSTTLITPGIISGFITVPAVTLTISTAPGETWTGSNGAAWAAPWVHVIGTSTIQSNTGQQVTGGNGWDQSLDYQPGLVNGDLLVKVQLQALTERYNNINFRFTATINDTGSGNSVRWSALTGLFEISRDISGSEVTLGSGSFSPAVGWFWVRVHWFNSLIQARIWPDGSGEPGTWTATASDATYQATVGNVALRTQTGSSGGAITSAWDDMTLAVSVQGPPTPAVVSAAATVPYPIISDGSPQTTMNSWLTTSTASSLLASQSPITSSTYTGVQGTRPVFIDANTTYQSMLGWGAAITDSAAYVIGTMPTSNKNALITELFSPTSGIGISFVRLPIGASDFSRTAFTFDDGSADPSLTNFSISHDLTYTVPVLQAALAANSNLKILGSPWSPPAWMKIGSTGLNGGTLNPTYYPAYAQYFVKFIQAYAAQGLPIYAITPQNEPLFNTAPYPCMGMSASEAVTFIGTHLGPALSAAGLSTKIITYDHNWDVTSYATTVLGDGTAGPYTSGSAWHAYAGTPDAMTTVHNAYPAKDIYFTEITGSQPGNFASDLQWHMMNIINGAPLNWARAVIEWNLVLDQNNGPIIGTWTQGQPIVTVNTGTAALTRYSTYYAIAHASKFVKPGAQRISCTTYGAGFIIAAGYKNPDGTRVIVASNNAGSAQTFKIIEGNKEWSVTIQAGDVQTFVLP